LYGTGIWVTVKHSDRASVLNDYIITHISELPFAIDQSQFFSAAHFPLVALYPFSRPKFDFISAQFPNPILITS
jgi:hypothetical protein